MVSNFKEPESHNFVINLIIMALHPSWLNINLYLDTAVRNEASSVNKQKVQLHREIMGGSPGDVSENPVT